MAIDKAIDSAVLDANLTTVADAIRAKGGTTDALSFPTGFADAISAIQAGGGGEDGIVLDALINRNITEISHNATSVGEAAFRGCSQLTTANLPAATSVGGYAFYNCSKLTTANIQAATSIGTYAFYGCSMLTAVDFPAVASIGTYAFHKSSGLTIANFPAVTSISDFAFHSCTKLKTVNFPIATSIGDSAFASCSTLEAVKFPAVTTVKASFGSCYMLKTVDLPVVTSIGKMAFANDTALSALILRSQTMCTLGNKNAISSGAAAVYIYVPSALVESYKSETNWSNFADRFRALEDYTVDGTITGELDESKI